MAGDGRSARGRRILVPLAVAAGLSAVAGIGLALRAPAQTEGPASSTAAPAGAKITITSGACSGGGTSFCFSPESATAGVGGKVVWTNQSGVEHTVTSCTSSACPAPASTGKNTFNLTIAPTNGSTGSFTFTSPGVYYYYCMIHTYSGMHGKITIFSVPSISSFSPRSGPPGTIVTINGQNLAHASAVRFNGNRSGVITSDSGTRIKVKVPSGAKTGRITVSTQGGTAETVNSFTVT